MQMFPNPDLISALHRDRHDRLTRGRRTKGASPPRRLDIGTARADRRSRRRDDA